MIRIAVVGNIGSGKTYVANLFKLPVFNADFEVLKIYKEDRSCFRKLKKKIPKFINIFPIDKKQILNAINEKKNNLKKISEIVHPIVRKKMNIFLRKNKYNKAVILDIPLYFENKINRKKDVIIYIDAKKSLINIALKKRNKYNLKILKKLSKLQISPKIKKRRSSYILINNFKSEVLSKKVRILKKKILDK